MDWQPAIDGPMGWRCWRADWRRDWRFAPSDKGRTEATAEWAGPL